MRTRITAYVKGYARCNVWREWEGDRDTKAVPDVGNHLEFSFLTTDVSPDVALIYPDATLILVFDEEARDARKLCVNSKSQRQLARLKLSGVI